MKLEEEAIEAEAPNRNRRSYFIIVTTLASLACVMYLAVNGTGQIAEKVSDGLVSFMMTTVLAYVVGHSVDRADFINQIKALTNRK